MLNYSSHSRHKANQKSLKKRIILTYLISILSLSFITFMYLGKGFNFLGYNKHFNQWMIGGIPSAIIFDVISDPEAVSHFLLGDRQSLRSRLKQLGVDQKMINLYRPYFSNEIELERYVDQIFYNDSGYANSQEYKVDQKGNLIRKKEPPKSEAPVTPTQNTGLFDVIKPPSP